MPMAKQNGKSAAVEAALFADWVQPRAGSDMFSQMQQSLLRCDPLHRRWQPADISDLIQTCSMDPEKYNSP